MAIVVLATSFTVGVYMVVHRRSYTNRVCPSGPWNTLQADGVCVASPIVLSMYVLRPSVIVMQKIRYSKLPS